MRYRFPALMALSTLVVFTFAPRANAVISASGDGSQPSQTTNVPRTGGSFQIFESVDLNPANGPWHKNLINNQNNASGQHVQILEQLFNVGAETWTDWHEQVLTRTTISTPNDQPGFLFDHNSLQVLADYGSGQILLTQGVHYTVSPTVYSGPTGTGNDNNWEAIDIFLAPGFGIAPGNSLFIQKQIFEVFLDGDIWINGEAAQIAQFPTVPEPTGIALVVMGASLLARRRRAV